MKFKVGDKVRLNTNPLFQGTKPKDSAEPFTIQPPEVIALIDEKNIMFVNDSVWRSEQFFDKVEE
jgi:hypothetical protein